MARETSSKNKGRSDAVGIFQVWKEAFHEDDQYINFFINHGLPLGNALSYGPTDAPFATLTLFPISFEQAGVIYSGYYLYALGTLLSKRGKGYGSLLVKNAEKYALEMGRQFILLQPTDKGLFEYYHKIGYQTPVYRACFKCSRTTLHKPSERENILRLLSNLSVPCETNQPNERSFSHFLWSDPMRTYIRKECLLRGGVVINGAYCYPTIDNKGHYLEIKEFQASDGQLRGLIETMLSSFPSIDRFCFYGKPQQIEREGVRNETFALVHFIDSEVRRNYNPQYGYFALGLD